MRTQITIKTLEEYFCAALDKGVIDHALRAQKNSDGRISFYIHPARENGDTADFIVDGNTLTLGPWRADISIPKDLDAAIEFLKTQPLKQDAERVSERAFRNRGHHSIGRHLRNTWGLWRNSALAQWFKARGIHHADDMSSIILTSFWRTVNGIQRDLVGQIAHYREYWKNQGQDPDNI